MKLVSVNTGLPSNVTWHGRNVTTGIFKHPVQGRVALRKLNLDGDRQADLSVRTLRLLEGRIAWPGVAHGQLWRKLHRGWLLEDSVHLGDRFSVGSAEVVVTQPRLPCYKLGIRFESDDMVKRFLASGRTGFYFAVIREGEVGAGDEIKVIARDPNGIPVSEITRLYVAKRYGDADVSWVQRALRVAVLPESWKEYFRQRLERIPI